MISEGKKHYGYVQIKRFIRYTKWQEGRNNEAILLI